MLDEKSGNGGLIELDQSGRNLYYELGYQPSTSIGEIQSVRSDVLSYLFMITTLMVFVFSINIILTLGLIILYYVSKNYLKDTFTKNYDLGALVIIFAVYQFEHLQQMIVILPGELISENIPFIIWLSEIGWIILFSTQLLLVNQPATSRVSKGKTISPSSPEARASYNNLMARLSGSRYEVKEMEDNIDTNLIRTSFTDLIKFLFGIMLLVIIVDSIIWQILNNIAGGDNITEIYIVSGMAFILYLALLFISSWFTNERSNNLDEK